MSFIFITICHLFIISFAYRWIAWHISLLIPFSTINSILMSFIRSTFALVLFKVTCNANPGVVRKRAGSSSYISRHIFRNFSDTSASNNVSLWTNKSWYSPNNNFILFRSCNLHHLHLYIMSCKNLLFQVLTFFWIFSNYLYIHDGKHLFAKIN